MNNRVINYFKNKIRDVSSNDKEKLSIFSYSRLELFKNCPKQYYLQYIENKAILENTLPLMLGSICHKVLEEKGKIIKARTLVKSDYDWLDQILINGIEDTDKQYQNRIPGTKEIKKKFFEEWYSPDNTTGMNYEDKMKIFNQVLHRSMEDETETDYGMWVPLEFEKYFEFVWKDRCILHGYIDRIDEYRDERLRCIDYKTSKKIYGSDKTATSLQFGIYSLAILNEYDRLPVENIYDFILLDKKQQALTKGWEKRFEKKLDSILDDIDEMMISSVAPAKPSPLCHWCSYSKTNPKATKYKYECDYHSNWTPNNKDFSVNKKWTLEEDKKPKRKLIF